MIYTYYKSKVNYQLANSTQHTCSRTSSTAVVGVAWYFQFFLSFMIPCLLNAPNFRNLIKRFQEFLEFCDFCTVVGCCEAASFPLHYGNVVLQWLTSIERKSLEILNYAIWEGSYFFSFLLSLLNLLSLNFVSEMFCLILASGVLCLYNLRLGLGISGLNLLFFSCVFSIYGNSRARFGIFRNFGIDGVCKIYIVRSIRLSCCFLFLSLHWLRILCRI